MVGPTRFERKSIWLCAAILALSSLSSAQHHQQPPPQHHQQSPQHHQGQPPPQHHQGQPPQHQQAQGQPPPQGHQQQQQHPPPQGGHHQQPPPGQAGQAHQFGAQNEVHDQQHIKSHLEGQVNVDEKKMTNEQLQFHYFSMHDLNKDSMLDGVELIKAITHWHGPEGSEPAHGPPQLAENEIEDMIDSILKDDDFNDDGYIDYSEFVKAQASRMGSQGDQGANQV